MRSGCGAKSPIRCRMPRSPWRNAPRAIGYAATPQRRRGRWRPDVGTVAAHALRLAHPELVHAGKCAGSFGFEAVPAVEIGHCCRVRKARRETLGDGRIKNESRELRAVLGQESLDLRQT